MTQIIREYIQRYTDADREIRVLDAEYEALTNKWADAYKKNAALQNQITNISGVEKFLAGIEEEANQLVVKTAEIAELPLEEFIEKASRIHDNINGAGSFNKKFRKNIFTNKWSDKTINDIIEWYNQTSKAVMRNYDVKIRWCLNRIKEFKEIEAKKIAGAKEYTEFEKEISSQYKQLEEDLDTARDKLYRIRAFYSPQIFGEGELMGSYWENSPMSFLSAVCNKYEMFNGELSLNACADKVKAEEREEAHRRNLEEIEKQTEWNRHWEEMSQIDAQNAYYNKMTDIAQKESDARMRADEAERRRKEIARDKYKSYVDAAHFGLETERKFAKAKAEKALADLL